MKEIADFFVKVLMKSPKFNSSSPVDDQTLLLAEFYDKLRYCGGIYTQNYPNQRITFSETYRSNVLQEKYYNNGASKIKKNGMHHYGIAADTIFVIDGKRSYKGDINLIRRIYKDNGLTILGMWDALHVQFIAVSDQQSLRDMVDEAVKNQE